ncbi:MAG: 2-hydroxyacyl-CoA dehydratase subunit D [Planctomycetota bacterium]|jgi:benzoyl-CoA reductase/2-hydroxyglutaryl-CoA dehydratase subunit BcrC/BadD/HgdB
MNLQTRFDIFGFYEEVRRSGQPITWCSAFAPAEVLLAAGVMPVYPENHAAMLGALSPDRDLQRPYALAAIDRSVASGLKTGPLCSYAMADIGVLLGDADSPIHGLPPADLFYACNSQCSVVERWGDQVQRILGQRERDIPHYVMRVPRLTKREEHTAEELADLRGQVEGHVADICSRLSTTFTESRLREVVRESNRANRLWQQCVDLAKRVPAPWSITDAFTAMAPIVIARGLPQATAFYENLHAELSQRVADGVQSVDPQRVRLIWDAIPIWPRKRWLADFAAEREAIFVASTYTHSWWFEFDEDNALDSLVKRYAWNTMSRSTEWILGWTLDLVREFQADGIVCHWNESCGIWNSYVKRRLAGYAEAGVPHIVIKADMVDARLFDEQAIAEQLGGFISELAAQK